MTALAGSIIATDAVAIYANTPTFVAGGSIDVQIEGNRGALNALAGGNISITAISKDNATSRISVGNVISTGGNVQLIAAHGITAATGSSLVAGNRLELLAPMPALSAPQVSRCRSIVVQVAESLVDWPPGDAMPSRSRKRSAI